MILLGTCVLLWPQPDLAASLAPLVRDLAVSRVCVSVMRLLGGGLTVAQVKLTLLHPVG